MQLSDSLTSLASRLCVVVVSFVVMLSSYDMCAQRKSSKTKATTTKAVIREVTIEGTVVDQYRETLGGVTLYVWGLDLHTETDRDGKFTLRVSEPGDSVTLVCRYFTIDPYFYVVPVQSEQAMVNIVLQMNYGGPCLVSFRRVSFRKWWWQFRGLFDK